MPVKKFEGYGSMASCPNTVGRWILNINGWVVGIIGKIFEDFARAKGLEAIWQ